MRTVLQTIAVCIALSLGLGGQPALAGQSSWPQTWGGPRQDVGVSVALDAQGNVYVAGNTTSFGAGGVDVLILKYSASGTLQWAKTWGGPDYDTAFRIAVGPDGYIYVTGNTLSYGFGWSAVFLLKLDTNGDLQWGQAWGQGADNVGYDLGFDQAGNIYVVGAINNGSAGVTNPAVILKFSSTDGALLWSTLWQGEATSDSGYAGGYSLTVDANFNVIIAGSAGDFSTDVSHNVIFLLKYDSSGNYLWNEIWYTPWSGSAMPQDGATPAHSLATDGNGNIYIGGQHSNNCPSSNFSECEFSALVLKVDTNGNFQWARTWGNPGYDWAGGLGIDSAGHLLVAGDENAPRRKLFVLSYSADDGTLLSSVAGNGASTFTGDLPGLAINSAGNAWIAASAKDNSGAWVAASAPAGSLPNSFIFGLASSVTTPPGQTMALTTPTQSQTGVINTGGGKADMLVVVYPHSLSAGPFQNFPPLN